LIAVLGFVSTSRIVFRIIEPPFTISPADIGVAAYLALLSAALVLASGIVQAVAQQREAARESVSDRP